MRAEDGADGVDGRDIPGAERQQIGGVGVEVGDRRVPRRCGDTDDADCERPHSTCGGTVMTMFSRLLGMWPARACIIGFGTAATRVRETLHRRNSRHSRRSVDGGLTRTPARRPEHRSRQSRRTKSPAAETIRKCVGD